MRVLCKFGAHSWVASDRVTTDGTTRPAHADAYTGAQPFSCACRRCAQQRVYRAGRWSIVQA